TTSVQDYSFRADRFTSVGHPTAITAHITDGPSAITRLHCNKMEFGIQAPTLDLEAFGKPELLLRVTDRETSTSQPETPCSMLITAAGITATALPSPTLPATN